jgi:hypothetical protein
MTEKVRWTKVAFDSVHRGSKSQHTQETISVEGGGKGDRKMPDLHYRRVEVAGIDTEIPKANSGLKLKSRNRK